MLNVLSLFYGILFLCVCAEQQVKQVLDTHVCVDREGGFCENTETL